MQNKRLRDNENANNEADDVAEPGKQPNKQQPLEAIIEECNDDDETNKQPIAEEIETNDDATVTSSASNRPSRNRN